MKESILCLMQFFFYLCPCRGDLSESYRPLVVTRRSQIGICHHQRYSGTQDGNTHVHRITVSSRTGVPLPKSKSLLLFKKTLRVIQHILNVIQWDYDLELGSDWLLLSWIIFVCISGWTKSGFVIVITSNPIT